MRLQILSSLIMPLALAAVVDDKKSAAPADTEQARKTGPKAVAPKPTNAGPLTVPDGAKEIEPYLYRYTDADGKRWMYRKTPFGVVRFEDKPVEQPEKANIDNTNPIVITEEGDMVKFQWTTPFGMQKWSKKKSELTDDEKAMIAREKAKAKKAAEVSPK